MSNSSLRRRDWKYLDEDPFNMQGWIQYEEEHMGALRKVLGQVAAVILLSFPLNNLISIIEVRKPPLACGGSQTLVLQHRYKSGRQQQRIYASAGGSPQVGRSVAETTFLETKPKC